MKKISIILFAAAIAGGVANAQNAVTMQTCEYWFDYDFEHRQTVAMNGNEQYTQQFDVSAMSQGVHSIGFRFGDSKGRWCSPFVKHFVIPTLPPATYEDNQIVKMEYWFDYDFDNRKTLESADGNAAVALDISAMAKGVHSIGYRAVDSRGIYTAPFVKHFVVPNFATEPTITGITAYEYWFNHGPRVRVEVDEQNPLDLQNLVIEVKDVVPNAITSDYQFDVEKGVVYVSDKVTFGIQAFDNVGHPSGGVVSEAIDYVVPVDLHVEGLDANVTEEVASPQLGQMQGFEVEAEPGDDVVFVIDGTGSLDLYDAEGHSVEVVKEQDGVTGQTSYRALAPTRKLYALLWNVPLAMETVQVQYTTFNATGVDDVLADGWHIHSSKGVLSVTAPLACDIAVYSPGGVEVARRRVQQGSTSFSLPSGTYILKFNHQKAHKVVVQ